LAHNEKQEKWDDVFATPLIAFVYFYPEFSEKLLLLGIPWTITAPMAMLLLAIFFKKKRGIENHIED